jgi:hypothetical protein
VVGTPTDELRTRAMEAAAQITLEYR